MSDEQTRFVYVVTSGEYSDYHIDGVFDNRPDAEYYAEHFAGEYYSKARVEEYELNPASRIIAEGMRGYKVVMYRNGDTEGVTEKTAKVGGELEAIIKTVGEYNLSSGTWLMLNHQFEEKEEFLAWLAMPINAELAHKIAANQARPVALHMTVIARNEQHAIKIVNEYRTQLIARNRWPADDELDRGRDGTYYSYIYDLEAVSE